MVNAHSSEARHMSSSKASSAGVNDVRVCEQGMWDSISTFRKYYRRTAEADPPPLVDPSFSAAIRHGIRQLQGSAKAVALLSNINRMLDLSQNDLNCSAKSSQTKSLRTTYKVSQPQVLRAIKAEMKGAAYSFSNVTRRSSGT